MWKMASLRRIGPCFSTGSEVCAMPINTLSWAYPMEEKMQASIDLAERFTERMERLLEETRGEAG
jgi:hypothetical protein